MGTRRKNGEGCFSVKGKSFEYRVPNPIKTASKKFLYYYGKTKEECILKHKKWLKEECDFGAGTITSNSTIEEWANFWFDNYVLETVKITTINDDRSILDHHIIPELGHIKLKDLRGLILQEFYNSLLKKDNGKNGTLSGKTVKNIRSVVNRMLICAYNNDLIKENVNQKTRLKHPIKKEVNPPTAEEQQKIIKDCIKNNTILDNLIIFQLATGLRLGETLGLQWSKINTEKNIISVEQQVQSVPSTSKNAKYKFEKQIIKTTKTKKSKRQLPYGKFLTELFSRLKKIQATNKLKHGDNYDKEKDLVFCNDKGGFICDTVYRKFLNDKLAKLGISHCRIHDLRHAFATRLFEEGKIKTKTISDYLGHTSITTTLDIYTHVMQNELFCVSNATDNIINEMLDIEQEKKYNNIIPFKRFSARKNSGDSNKK